MQTLLCLVAAVLIKTSSLRWDMLDRWIRVAPLVILVFLVLFRLSEGWQRRFRNGAGTLPGLRCRCAWRR